ncbi:hypothetical protein B7R22_06575 [Subtercola boreus]|uniref:Uncharacterized protein n=1 Tax=Subtercola boreus TaxID=120213 RepID=A0A3E0W207_9MICO|nr:hypothetical protein [Subtercola boreus]RFA15608.1 hypothetical protein B7R22_06575 [Subtercola boreus]
MNGIPIQVFESPSDEHWNERLDWTELVSLEGSWHVIDNGKWETPQIYFETDARPGHLAYGTFLDVTGTVADPRLSYIYGDPDNENRFVFRRSD